MTWEWTPDTLGALETFLRERGITEGRSRPRGSVTDIPT